MDFRLFLTVIFLLSKAATGSNVIKTVPNYDGELPFTLETGLVYFFFFTCLFLIIFVDWLGNVFAYERL